jgi:nicotinamidase-related amidase
MPLYGPVAFEEVQVTSQRRTALLLVDLQRDMLELPRPVPNADDVRQAVALLLAIAREANVTIVHVQNDGRSGELDEPFTPGWELVFPPADGELVVRKREEDAFSGTSLAAELRARDVEYVVVAGTLSNYCVQATARGALHNGFEVVLASGAHATYDEQESADVLAAEVEAVLAREGVWIVPVAEIAFRA